MTTTIRFADPAAADDLATFLGRAAAVLDGAVRLIADAGVLAVYAPVLTPAGLLDDAATVLGLRTVALADRALAVDEVVPIASMRARLTAAVDGVVGVPAPVYSVTWAGIAPPRGGWVRLRSSVSAAVVSKIADAGIREVAAALPADPGEAIVRQVRQAVWNEPMPGFDALPRGAAFAAAALGFIGDEDEDAVAYELGPWSRLTLRRGHVLVKRRAWSLAR